MLADTEFNSAAQLTCRECVEGALLGERLGFSTVWKGEGNNRAPGIVLAAIAARTSRIAVGGGVNHVFARTPVSFAVEAATLNELADGRYIAGLGVGNETVARWHGSVYRTPTKIIREYVSVVRRVYAGERWDGGGQWFTGAGFKLAFTPPKTPLPVWLGVLGPRMSRLAGEIADGVLVNVGDPRVVSRIAEDVAAGARAAGRPAGAVELAAKFRVSLNPDLGRARAALKRPVTFFALSDSYRATLDEMGWEPVVSSVRAAYRSGGFPTAMAQIPDEMLESLPTLAATDLDTLGTRLRPFAEAGCSRCVLAYVPSTDSAWEETRTFLEAAPLRDGVLAL